MRAIHTYIHTRMYASISSETRGCARGHVGTWACCMARYMDAQIGNWKWNWILPACYGCGGRVRKLLTEVRKLSTEEMGRDAIERREDGGGGGGGLAG